MRLQCLLIAFSLIVSCCDIFAGWDLDSSLAQTNRTTPDKELEGNLQVFADDDGGVYALKVMVTNLSTNDLVLELSDVPALNLYVMLRAGGKSIHKPLPKLKDFEGHIVEMKLNRASGVEWFARLSDHIADTNSLPESTSASLGVIFRFAYRPSGVVDDPTAVKFATFDFLVTPITLTSNAIRGNAAEKFERRVLK